MGDDLPQTTKPVTIEVGDQLITGLSRTYDEGGDLLALIGSGGYLEVSLKGGDASAFLDANVGNEVKVKLARG
jgi:S-adenosylmethionine hydrolase